MKRILFILTAMLMLSSCGKDGDEPSVNYTVTFDTDGGNPTPSSQTIKAGETAIAPTSPTKQGYVFLFWHLNNASTAYNFQTPVNSDLILKAKWESEEVAEYWQVTWELNGGSWPATGDSPEIQVVKGGMLAEPAAPTKGGKIFDGWYKEAALTNKINFPYSVSAVTDDFTLYAKWSEPAAEYWQITWELNGGTWPETGDNHVDKVEKSSILTEPTAPTKSGSTFEGWYKDAALTNKITFPVTVTSDSKLYAKWGVYIDDRNLQRAAYCLAYTIKIKEQLNKGLRPGYIMNEQGAQVLTVKYNSNATVDCLEFYAYNSSNILSWTTITSFSYNTPRVICELTSGSNSKALAASFDISNGTYDYTNDPANFIAYFGAFTGPLFFSVSELGGKSTLEKMKIVANNEGITADALNNVKYPSNSSYKILIFGKNKNGDLIGKYIGYTTDGSRFDYWHLDPDDPKFGQGATISIP